jgi:hypothetical protein
MAAQLTDAEIARLLAVSKPLLRDFRSRIQTRPKRGHEERELDVAAEDGSSFRLILRRSVANALDFSVILAYRIPGTNQVFRLRRYNGKSHEHTNPLEGETFYDFHVHTATERYQDSGLREDTFAEPTDRFADFDGALRCLLTECGLVLPEDPQESLF